MNICRCFFIKIRLAKRHRPNNFRNVLSLMRTNTLRYSYLRITNMQLVGRLISEVYEYASLFIPTQFKIKKLLKNYSAVVSTNISINSLANTGSACTLFTQICNFLIAHSSLSSTIRIGMLLA